MASDLTNFMNCALASGLIVPEELDDALAKLRKMAIAQGKPPADPLPQKLAEQLVENERLNRWQADQLLAGRSKFNLGPYQVIDSIGQGGMGQVFKAEHTVMGRIVAVKVLPKHKSTPEAVAAFNREVRLQAQLDHENLVRAHDAGHDGNVHFLVTEFVPGTDLRKLIRTGGRLSLQQAASIISQSAKGLEYAHNRGLVHRDIKPGNILVTPDGRAKVSDLGLAAFFSEEDLDDRQGKIVGTADYLAPEQILNPGTTSALGDIYSLGCTLYYATTGKVPFPGGTPREKARSHCTKTPVDPRRLNPEITADFAEAIARLMAKEPTERPQTAAEVIKLLAPWSQTPAALTSVPPVNSPSTIGKRTNPGNAEHNFLVQPRPEPGQEDSGSQASQRTPSMASEDTLPALDVSDFSGLPGMLQSLILIGSVTVLLMLAAAIGISLV